MTETETLLYKTKHLSGGATTTTTTNTTTTTHNNDNNATTTTSSSLLAAPAGQRLWGIGTTEWATVADFGVERKTTSTILPFSK